MGAKRSEEVAPLRNRLWPRDRRRLIIPSSSDVVQADPSLLRGPDDFHIRPALTVIDEDVHRLPGLQNEPF